MEMYLKHTLTHFHQTLWTSSEADPSAESAAPAEKKEEAPAAEGEKPAE
jgi:14-3-3 protein epsilon